MILIYYSTLHEDYLLCQLNVRTVLDIELHESSLLANTSYGTCVYYFVAVIF